MPRLFLAVACFLASLAPCFAKPSPEDAVFIVGSLPLDTDGNEVHAHGGGMLQQNDAFFWYGTTQKYPPAWISKGINLYSSIDLEHWQFEGQIFEDGQIQDVGFQHPYRIERPKILYDAKSCIYTLLFHLDTPNFAMTSVGIAKAGNIRGPWKWVKGFKPDGLDSFDMTAWQEKNGTGYIARSVQNAYLGVSKLDDGFTKTTGICASTQQAEAPAIFQPEEGQYFIIASHLTGWAANPPQMFAVMGETLCNGRLHPVDPPAQGPGSETTFDSQPAYVFPLHMEDNTTLFIYMGDRWNFYGPGSVGRASYVWLPLVRAGNTFQLAYRERWSPRDFSKAMPRAHLSENAFEL